MVRCGWTLAGLAALAGLGWLGLLGCARENPEFGLGESGGGGGTTSTTGAADGVSAPVGDDTRGQADGTTGGIGTTFDTTVASSADSLGVDDDDGDPPDTGDQCGDLQACEMFVDVCGANLKCAPTDIDGDSIPDGNFCIDAGFALPGERCIASCGGDTCDDTSACLLLVDEPLGGVCVQYCNPEVGPAAGCRAECIAIGPDYGLCHGCDPFLHDCDIEQGCYFEPTGFVCAIAGTGQPGDPCESPDACEVGLACLPGGLVPDCPMGEHCCVVTCENDQGCGDGAECLLLNPTPGFPIGFCPAA